MKLSIAETNYKLIESELIRPGESYLNKDNNDLYIPNDGTIYKMLFLASVDKEIVEVACKYALEKVLTSISKN